MEVEGVRRNWLRSQSELKLHYTSFVGDGNAKSFSTLVQLNGPDVTKHVCVGYVQKRLGTALRRLKKLGVLDENGKVVKFKDRLTDKAIDSLNVYYSGTIRNRYKQLMLLSCIQCQLIPIRFT